MNFYPNYNNFNSTPSLNGRIVESYEVAKITDVPFGSFGVFPKADFGEVYIKTWNNNGTTTVKRYAAVEEAPSIENNTNDLIARIEELENTVANLVKPAVAPAPASPKKEVIF